MRHFRPWRRAGMATILCLGLATAAQARGLLGLFADDPPSVLPAPSAPSPRPAKPDDPPDRPVAWISALRNVDDPAAVLYGYVRAGTRIDLGKDGEITLTWLSPCREEDITGGIVTVTAAGPQVSGAPASRSHVLSCQPLKLVLPEDGGPSPPSTRSIVAVNAPEPLFLWPKAAGSVSLALMDPAEHEAPALWSATVDGGAVAYPHGAPRLEENKPYLIRATLPSGVIYEARFSYDPALRYSSAPINALILLHAGGA